MTRRPRRNHRPAFKAKVAIAAIKSEKTMIELSQELDIHPNQIKQWRDQLLDGATALFWRGGKTCRRAGDRRENTAYECHLAPRTRERGARHALATHPLKVNAA